MSDAIPPGAIPLPPGAMKLAAHPWQTTTDKARQGLTPDDKPIGQELVKPFTNPESLGDYATGAALTAPLVMAGGAGAPMLASRLGLPAAAQALAPAAGRVAAQGAVGAMRGEGLEEAGKAAAVEALVPGLGKVASKIPYANKVLQPAEAIAEIEKRIGQGADGSVNLKLFRKWMEKFNATKGGMAREVEARRIADAIADEAQGLGDKEAAFLFSKYVGGGKVTPTTSEKVTNALKPGNVGQSIVDVLGSGTPLPLLAAGAAKGSSMLPAAIRNLLP